MDLEHYGFFAGHVGPSPNDLFAPAELARLTPAERKLRIQQALWRINRAEAGVDDYRRLAVLTWKEGRVADARKHMAQAVKLNPVEPRSMYSLAFLCEQVDVRDKAREAYEETVAIAPNTIWHILASDALLRL
jgi:Flp pilus assembly protein TadD